MFTDMVGSTALAQTDEVEALRLRDEQEGLVRPLFAAHQGRAIKSMGDGFLVEFDSALHAVQCAIDIQQHLNERNLRQGKAPILLRIGVHLGDVEQRETDIFGDAVNIASRIEPLAPPGGVCISGEVFSQVRNKIPNKLEKQPPTALKGLLVPIDLYRVVLPWTVRAPVSSGSGPTRLAVLPFANISPDLKDEYFADGLTEELITTLSQIPGLQVIARTSVNHYKANPKSIAQIGVELGVPTILEGSVRKAGDQLRITVQLIDVGSQGHTWANTYDRKLDDVFAVQTDVAKRIAGVLKIRLDNREASRLAERPTVNNDSYLAYLRGRSLLFARWSRERVREAKQGFERAIAIDPTNARAHSGLSDALGDLDWEDWEEFGSEEAWIAFRRAHTARAVELEPQLAEAHCSLAMILQHDWRFGEAEKEFKLALSLNPSYAFAHHSYGLLLAVEAQPEEALREVIRAEELDPHSAVNVQTKACLLIMLRRLVEAEATLDRARALREYEPVSDFRYHCWLAWLYNVKPDIPRAIQEISRVEELAQFGETPDMDKMEVAMHSALAGEKVKARENLEALKRTTNPYHAPWRAMAYSLLGDFDECFRLLGEAFDRHYYDYLYVLRCEPRFEPIVKDPRFVELLKKMNLT